MSAARRSSCTTRQRAAIGCSDKIVADVDAVFLGVGDLDDGARVVALGVAVREVRERAGVLHGAFGRRRDPHDRAVYLAHIGLAACTTPTSYVSRITQVPTG